MHEIETITQGATETKCLSYLLLMEYEISSEICGKFVKFIGEKKMARVYKSISHTQQYLLLTQMSILLSFRLPFISYPPHLFDAFWSLGYENLAS